jgi:hypothetical protein
MYVGEETCVVIVLVELEVVEEIKERDTRQTCVNPAARLERHIWQTHRTNVSNSKEGPSPRFKD